MFRLDVLSRTQGEAAACARPRVVPFFKDARSCTADLDRLRRERLYADQRARELELEQHTRQVIERRRAARAGLMGETA